MANNNNNINWGSDIRYTALVTKQQQIDELSEILDAAGRSGEPYWFGLGTQLGEKPIYLTKLLNMTNHTTKSGGKEILNNWQHSKEATIQNYIRIFQKLNCESAILLITQWIFEAKESVIPKNHPLRSVGYLKLEEVQLDPRAQDQSDCLIETTGLPEVSAAALPDRLFWPKSSKLLIYFMESNHPELQEKIIKYVVAWTEHSDIKFERTPNRDESHIRITFAGKGCHSVIGRDALQIAKDKPTMCLADLVNQPNDEDIRRTVLHEFGHALGLIHEHQRPDVEIPFDVKKTIAYYQKYFGWTPQQVHDNILKPKHNGNYVLRCKTEFDSESIMIYPLPDTLLDSSKPNYQLWKDKFPSQHTKDLSNTDKEIFREFYKLPPLK